MLHVYADFCEEFLAIPVIRGQKTEKERFAGAEATFTIEALMHDGQALQSGTSHDFGDGFARAFNIQYTDKDNKLQYVHQTSWGLSTRIIGAIIMVHGDNDGLKLPPHIAPVQVMICPIQQQKAGVLDKAAELLGRLKKAGLRVRLDDREKTPGFKFADCEMRGIPLRVEIGPRDIENNQAVLVRRDTREKTVVSLDELEKTAADMLEDIQKNMFEMAKEHLEKHTFIAKTIDEMEEILDDKTGFVKAMWCGDRACEDAVKEKTGATSRCIPFKQECICDTCINCGKPAQKMVYWGRAY
jgi:prolyl-tRNA synthetase